MNHNSMKKKIIDLIKKTLRIFLFFCISFVILYIFILSTIDNNQFEFDNLIIKIDENSSKVILKNIE